MKASKAWGFIANNIISLVTVFLGIAVIVLDELGLLSASIVSSTILALLVLLATSELVESRRKLSDIDEELSKMSEQLTQAVQGISVQVFPSSDEVLDYLIGRTREAHLSVDQASIDYRRTRMTRKRMIYNQAREKLILSGRVKYRYVGVLYSERRLELARKCALEKNAHRFFAGFYPKPSSDLPLLNFVVFDNEEVLARYPFGPGQETTYIVIRSPQIARLFIGYFERLWERAEKLQSEEDFNRLLATCTDE